MEIWYKNFYRCSGDSAEPHDEAEWEDSWSATCNDECPVCGCEIEPYYSEDYDAE